MKSKPKFVDVVEYWVQGVCSLIYLAWLVSAHLLFSHVKWISDLVPYELEIVTGFIAITVGLTALRRIRQPDQISTAQMSVEESIKKSQGEIISADKQYIDDLRSDIRKMIGCRFVRGHDAVYEDATRMATQGEHKLQELLMGASPASPIEFSEAVSSRLVQCPSMKYKVIIAVTPDVINSDDFWEKTDKRRQLYSDKGIQKKRLELKILKTSMPVGFDLLIVDEKHVHFCFPAIAGENEQRQMGIVFNGQENVAIELSSWFDSIPGIESYDDVRDRHYAKKQKAAGNTPST